VAKEIIKSVLQERLAGKQYSTDDTAKWTKEIASAIKQRLKGTSHFVLPDQTFFHMLLNTLAWI
jgi:hypothetical protein